MTMAHPWKLLLAPGLLLGLLLSIHVLPLDPVVSSAIVFITASCLFLWVAIRLPSARISRASLTLLLLGSLAVRCSFLTTDPVGSDDVYRYMWDGKVQSAGINPYRYAPDSPQLEQLHSTILPRMVNHPEMKTLYFPFSQWLFFVCYQLSGEDIWGYKLLIVLSEGLTILGLLLLTRHLRLPDQTVLLYALCPLPIVQFAGDAHIDAVGLPLLIFGLLAYAKGYRGRAALLLGFSMAVKPVALIILPALFLQEQNTKGRLMILLTPPLVLLLQFAPYLVAANPFDALGTFTANWTFNGIAFDLLNLFISDNQRARIVCGILLVLSLFLLYVRKKEFFERAYYSVLLLLLFSPVVHPWYVTWLAVLLPPVQRWSGIVFVSTVSLAGITAMQYRLTGEWEQTQAVLIIEYLPVIALLVLELWRGTGAPWRSSNSAMA